MRRQRISLQTNQRHIPPRSQLSLLSVSVIATDEYKAAEEQMERGGASLIGHSIVVMSDYIAHGISSEHVSDSFMSLLCVQISGVFSSAAHRQAYRVYGMLSRCHLA